MSKHRILIIVCLFGVITTGMFMFTQINAIVIPEEPDSTKSQYAPRELILKLAPEAGERLDAALELKKLHGKTGLAWFDELNTRYGVSKIETVFSQHTDIEEVQRKYPERAGRAPSGAKASSLKHIYKLTLGKDANIIEASAEYSAHPNVVYAQPNYLSTIYAK